MIKNQIQPSAKLRFPVKTLDGRLLLPEGSELTEESLSMMLASNPSAVLKTYPLMDHGSVKKDILSLFDRPPYDVVFSGADGVAEIMDVMKTVWFAAPVLEVLDFFKTHDAPTYHHMLTIFSLTILIARDLVPNYRKRVSEIAFGPTHDFGKICVPLDILKKQQPLTQNELEQLKHHTLAGYALLSYYFGDSRSLPALAARDHHERMNGSGYPNGIRQQDLMVEIVAVCDIYDALISPRPYRVDSYDNRAALEVLTAMAQKGEIGWRVVKALIAHNRTSKPKYLDAVVSAETRGAPPKENFYGILSDE
ncbi:MAG: HD domain-containing protein [Desulfobacteraceae bacterium]|nr:MAG: HD domain-containing protein [Desulfobacteraceae bacterium]